MCVCVQITAYALGLFGAGGRGPSICAIVSFLFMAIASAVAGAGAALDDERARGWRAGQAGMTIWFAQAAAAAVCASAFVFERWCPLSAYKRTAQSAN